MTNTTRIRTTRWHVIAVAAAITGLLSAAVPAAAAAEPPPAQPSAVDGLQERVDRIVAAGSLGAALLVRDGGGTESVAAGLAGVDTQRAVRAGDRFRVGSVTKSFVATLVLQLVGSGDLDLDASVADYRPGLLPDGDMITLRELLNHTSGLFNYVDDAEFYAAALAGEAFKPRELIDYSTRHGLLFPPGTSFAYSNTNYVVLGI